MLLVLLLACTHPARLGDSAAGSTVFAGPTASIRVEMDPFGLALVVDGEDRAVLAPGGLAIASVPHYDDSTNYDPWYLLEPQWSYAVPDGLTWQTVDAAQPDGNGGFTLLSAGTEVAALKTDGQRVTVSTAPEVPYVRIAFAANPNEQYYGLGETFGSVEHTGTRGAMQFEFDAELESGENEAHVPVPFLVGTEGWGWLVDSFRPGAWDVADSDPSRLETTWNSPGELSFELYAGETPAEVIAAMHRSQGMPEVPPVWAFSMLQWRNEVTSSDEVRADAAAMRENGIPSSCIWVDNPWQTTYNSLEPDPARFPDWDELVSELNAQGYRVMAWATPYVESEDPGYTDFAGHFVDAPMLMSDFGDLVDFTDSVARDLWTLRVQAAAERGIEGWKLDYGEDVQLGIGGVRLEYGFSDGSDERTMHHRYAWWYHHAFADPYGDGSGDDVFILGRGGALRGWTVTDAIWPGDLDNGFETFREDGTSVGGLSSAIRGGLSLAASGYPFFASDTGGFRGGRPTSEALIRWTEYSAMLPIFQLGGGGSDHNPWNFDDQGDTTYTQATLDAFVPYARLHTRLFPFFYSLAKRAGTEGLPVVLPVGLAFPDDGPWPASTDTEFVVGGALLVAPVHEAGVTDQEVRFPAGTWVHWWTAEAYTAETAFDRSVPAPLGQGPLFQRAGTAIPLLREGVQTLAATSDGTDSWANDPGVLTVRVVPGEGSAFSVEDGTVLQPTADGVTIAAGRRYTEGYRVKVWAPGATTATVDGQPVEATVEDPWVVVQMDGPGTVAVE